MHRAVAFDGIIFDMGDILYDASTWRRWLTAELQRLGIEITYSELVSRWEALLVDVYRGAAKYWERFGELLHTIGVADDAIASLTEDARRKAQEVRVGRKPMEGVPETLAALRAAGVRMAVLSDTESGEAKVRSLLGALGIEQFFDAVVTSADIGYVKPDPEAYRAAVDALAVDAPRCVFVGHDVDELEGARKASLFAVAYNYESNAPASVYIDTFGELCGVILNG